MFRLRSAVYKSTHIDSLSQIFRFNGTLRNIGEKEVFGSHTQQGLWLRATADTSDCPPSHPQY